MENGIPSKCGIKKQVGIATSIYEKLDSKAKLVRGDTLYLLEEKSTNKVLNPIYELNPNTQFHQRHTTWSKNTD